MRMIKPWQISQTNCAICPCRSMDECPTFVLQKRHKWFTASGKLVSRTVLKSKKSVMATEVKASSSNKQNLNILSESYEVNRMLLIISPRWKMVILFSISKGIKQFGLLKKALPTLSDQILGKRLKELVLNGLIDKVPINDGNQNLTCYLTTAKGSELLKILDLLNLWEQS